MKSVKEQHSMSKGSLRFRNAKSQEDALGQVFTPPAIARLLARSLPRDLELAVDLGAGGGSLAGALLERAPSAKMILVEKDQHHVKALRERMGTSHEVYRKDVLAGHGISDLIAGRTVSAFVSNPPYGMVRLPKTFSKARFKELLPQANAGEWARGDVAFLSEAWRHTVLGSHIAFIVSGAVVRDSALADLRKVLLEELTGATITELESSTFCGAEVQAYLIQGTRATKSRRVPRVMLRAADTSGKIVGEMYIPIQDAIRRADFAFHANAAALGMPTNRITTLSEIGATIARGTLTRKQSLKLGIFAFHTTNFVGMGDSLDFEDGQQNTKVNARFASVHDILIPRVGSRCLTYEARIINGSTAFTDCIYRVRVPDPYREMFWRTLKSNFGKEWRILNASGNCAKHLTIESLRSMPLHN